MSTERTQRQDPRLQGAIDELQELIRTRYPQASFEISMAADDPEIVHVVTTVDVEDTDEVVDLVIERELELQVEQGLPIHVIPIRPLERVIGMRRMAPGRRERVIHSAQLP